MDWKRAIAEERAALGRIAALLCALAGLAERAACRSVIVRCVVLMLLRRAEWVARDFVGGEAAAMPRLPLGNAPADALRLAAGLRALAGQVDRQAALLAGFGRDDAVRAAPPCPAPVASGLAICLSAILKSGLDRLPRVPAPDTS